MKYNIMFVDNSISVLESLQWLFKDEPYYVFSFDNPLDALKVINTLEWAVVVADQSMQNMDGLAFLQRFQTQSSHTVGIILTGYNEMKEAMDTLYPGYAYRFVKKPLNRIDIQQTVRAAISDYETNTGLNRQAIV